MDALQLDGTFHAVSDATRREILRLVRDEELAAGDIASRFRQMSRPAVSQHMRVLLESGLVDVRRSGRLRLYSIRPAPLLAGSRELDTLWRDRLGRLKLAAESVALDDHPDGR